MQRRDNGQWEPPSGVLELGETFEDGVRREVVEEAGTSVAVERLTGAYKNLTLGVVALVFRCSPLTGTSDPTEESQQVRWLTPDEVTELMAPVRAVRVLDALTDSVTTRAHDGVHVIVR